MKGRTRKEKLRSSCVPGINDDETVNFTLRIESYKSSEANPILPIKPKDTTEASSRKSIHLKKSFCDVLRTLIRKKELLGSILQVCRHLLLFRSVQEKLDKIQNRIGEREFGRISQMMAKPKAKGPISQLGSLFCGEGNQKKEMSGSPNKRINREKQTDHYNKCNIGQGTQQSLKGIELILHRAQKLIVIRTKSTESLLKLLKQANNQKAVDFEENLLRSLIENTSAQIKRGSQRSILGENKSFQVCGVCSRVDSEPNEEEMQKSHSFKFDMVLIEKLVHLIFQSVYSIFLNETEKFILKERNEQVLETISENLVGNSIGEISTVAHSLCSSTAELKNEVFLEALAKCKNGLGDGELGKRFAGLEEFESIRVFVKDFPFSVSERLKGPKLSLAPIGILEDFFSSFFNKTKSAIVKNFPKEKPEFLIQKALVYVLLSSQNKNIFIYMSLMELLQKNDFNAHPGLTETGIALKSIIEQEVQAKYSS